jgi:GDP-4-dehydro-6-deoxy-D-mannose reductase
LSDATGTKPTARQDPAKMRPSDTPLLVGSHEKLATDTGWQPEIALEKTFADVIADWRSRES